MFFKSNTGPKPFNYYFIYITMLKLHGKDNQAVLPISGKVSN